MPKRDRPSPLRVKKKKKRGKKKKTVRDPERFDVGVGCNLAPAEFSREFSTRRPVSSDSRTSVHFDRLPPRRFHHDRPSWSSPRRDEQSSDEYQRSPSRGRRRVRRCDELSSPRSSRHQRGARRWSPSPRRETRGWSQRIFSTDSSETSSTDTSSRTPSSPVTGASRHHARYPEVELSSTATSFRSGDTLRSPVTGASRHHARCLGTDITRSNRRQPAATLTRADFEQGESVPFSNSPSLHHDATQSTTASLTQTLSQSNRELIQSVWEILRRRARSIHEPVAPTSPTYLFPIPGLDAPPQDPPRPCSATLMRMADISASRKCPLEKDGSVSHSQFMPVFRLLAPTDPGLSFHAPDQADTPELRPTLNFLDLSMSQLRNLTQKADMFLSATNFLDLVTDSISAIDAVRPWSTQDLAEVSTLHKALRLVSRELSGVAMANAFTFRRLQREAVLAHSDLPSPVRRQCRDTTIEPGTLFSEDADRKVREYKESSAFLLQETLRQKRQSAPPTNPKRNKRPRQFSGGRKKAKRGTSTWSRDPPPKNSKRRYQPKRTHTNPATPTSTQPGQRS